MNNIIKNDNKLQFSLMLALFTSIFALNFCSKISACALVFTTIIIMANVLTEFYSRKTALLGTFLSSIISFALLWNFNYKIDGVVTSGIVLVSLISTFISVYVGTSILKSNINLSFYQRNFISFIACAFVDGIIMSGFFVNKFSNERILANFSKEIFYKIIYLSIAYLAIFAVSSLFQNMNKKTNSIAS